MNEQRSAVPSPALSESKINVQHEQTPASSASKTRYLSPIGTNKVVLLVDGNPRTRESRAKVLRTLGVDVHTVATTATARARLAAMKFDLVLVDPGRDSNDAESLLAEIRGNNRKQRVAFLVGRPLYVASSLKRSSSPVTPAISDVPKINPQLKTPALTDFGQRIKDAEAEIAI